MKTENRKETDLGFPKIESGTYRYEVLDNIRVIESEENSSYSHAIPIKVDSVVDGEGDVGTKGSVFINILKKDGGKNKMSDDTYQTLLTATGAMDALIEKTKGADIDLDDERFVTFIKTTLPGTFFEGTHTLKDGNMNWTNMRGINGKKAATDEPAEKSDW